MKERKSWSILMAGVYGRFRRAVLSTVPFSLVLYALLSLGSCKAIDSLNPSSGGDLIRERIDEADSCFKAGDAERARSILLPMVKGSLPELRALRLLSRMAQVEGNFHEALVWLDRANTATLELSLICMDRSRILWELEGGPLALADIGLSLDLLDRVARDADPSWEKLGALRDLGMALENAYRGGLPAAQAGVAGE